MEKENFSKYKYTIKKKDGNPEESIILKTGIEAEFTMRQIQDEISQINKRKMEMEAKKKLSEATIDNIKRNPDAGILEKVTDKERVVIFLYEKAMMESKAADEILKSINDGLEEYGKEIDEIKKQTKLESPKNE